MSQLRLFAEPETPQEYADFWDVKLLDEVPVPGPATLADWRDSAEGTRRWPGRNRPAVGAWLHDRYAAPSAVCADPMIGAGSLWTAIDRNKIEFQILYGCEVAEPGVPIAQENVNRAGWLAVVEKGDARYWRPQMNSKASFIQFSPVFGENHSSGDGEHQQQIREEKGLHAIMEWPDDPAQIGNMDRDDQFRAMERVYANVRTYFHVDHGAAVMAVILRNCVRRGGERDDMSEHLSLIRRAGFEVFGLHWRDLLRPVGMTAWKFAADPNTPWIDLEWMVMCR